MHTNIHTYIYIYTVERGMGRVEPMMNKWRINEMNYALLNTYIQTLTYLYVCIYLLIITITMTIMI